MLEGMLLLAWRVKVWFRIHWCGRDRVRELLRDTLRDAAKPLQIES